MKLKPGDADFPTLALSVRQPWAWAIIHAGKHLENRSPAALKHMLGRQRRGRIVIHAAKGMTRDEFESGRDCIARAVAFHGKPRVECPRPDELVRGALIGTVEVLGTLGPDGSTSPWWAGGHALRLAAPEALDEPWPLTGALGYFEWDEIERHKQAIEPPLPWMTAWPGEPDRKGRPKPAPAAGLFD